MSFTDVLLNELRDDARIRNVVVGSFWSLVVLDTDPVRCGLASTLRGEPGGSESPVSGAGKLQNLTARQLSELLRSSNVMEASIGMAAFNALLDVEEAACRERNAAELIMERGAGKRVAIVGHFPFVERIGEVADVCSVLELRPREGDFPAQHAEKILPAADVIGITSTSLINHTFEGLIKLCRDDAFVVLLGGSTPLTPVLFHQGVDAIAGTRITDVSAVQFAVTQGATFRQIPGKRLVMMTNLKRSFR